MTLILITITVMFAWLLSYIYYYKEPLSNKEKYEELINKIRTDCIDDNKIRIIKLSSMHKYVIRFWDNNDLDIEINTLGNRWCSFDSIWRRNRDYFYYRIYEEWKLSDPYFVESSHLYNENKIAQMALRKEDENLILFKKNTIR
jgi:hypothetical protein